MLFSITKDRRYKQTGRERERFVDNFAYLEQANVVNVRVAATRFAGLCPWQRNKDMRKLGQPADDQVAPSASSPPAEAQAKFAQLVTWIDS